MSLQFDLTAYPVRDVLDLLLKDKTMKRNIVFGTDSYTELGEDYTPEAQMTKKALLAMVETTSL